MVADIRSKALGEYAIEGKDVIVINNLRKPRVIENRF